MQPQSLLFALMAAQTAVATLPLRLVSWNIRYATTSLESGEKPWDDILCSVKSSRCRKPHVIDKLDDIQELGPAGGTTIIGLQEVLHNQLADVRNGLGGSWDSIGYGRDDGSKSGEYSPILYKTDDLKLLYSETKWLSPTPDKVSYGWGAGSRRIVTLAVFQHKNTGQKFIHANTHLDNVSAEARSQGILVVLARIKAAQATYGPLPVSLTGDFNSAPYADAFKTLSDTGYMQGELYDLAQPNKVSGANRLTYTTFSSTTSGSRIDFMWLGPKSGYDYTVQKYEIMDNLVDGMYLSDHRPVVGDVVIN